MSCEHDPRGVKVRMGGELVCYWCVLPEVMDLRANPPGRCSLKGCHSLAQPGAYYCSWHRNYASLCAPTGGAS